MSQNNVASAYAEAVFELAEESDCLDDICYELSTIAEIFSSNPELTQLLILPTLSKEERISVLQQVFSKTSGMLLDFLCLLTERGRINYICEIEKVFRKLYNQKNNIEEVTVTTGVELTEDERLRLTVKLQNKLNKRIKLIEKINKDIIGGVQLKYGDTLIDNSISSRIGSIAKELKDND
ncbi:MAG: ATP synthase F1 subunit delta [Ruminococcus sp.]|nr:ATP synthase F1 subunit delta [Ruminococcus sp.]